MQILPAAGIMLTPSERPSLRLRTGPKTGLSLRNVGMGLLSPEQTRSFSHMHGVESPRTRVKWPFWVNATGDEELEHDLESWRELYRGQDERCRAGQHS